MEGTAVVLGGEGEFGRAEVKDDLAIFEDDVAGCSLRKDSTAAAICWGDCSGSAEDALGGVLRVI
jgi:hypothetical protein